MKIHENYFKELREQITNTEKWDKDRLVVFDYEAGLGKSQNTLKFIGEMTKVEKYSVLYVQKFTREDELYTSVAFINRSAGRAVAFGFTGEESKKEVCRIQAKKTQILCCSHKMYESICKGNHKELIEDRDILIIDEFPDLVSRISLSEKDIGYLWMINSKYRNEILENLCFRLREKYEGISNGRESKKDNQMIFEDFGESEFKTIKIGIEELLKSVSDKHDESMLSRVLQVLTNGCFFYDKSFYTFDNEIRFKLLKNNIILDANGFDYRYNLSNKFIVKKQPKFFSYNHSIFHHYEVKTGKKELSKQINLPEKAFEAISIIDKKKTLIITDKENQQTIENKVVDYLYRYGIEANEAKKMLSDTIRIDYFGNIIGVNTYRDFDNVVVLKTPNYDYLTYALTYFYYRNMDGIQGEDVQVFQHEIVEDIRKTTIAGEIYQAIKRINRDNSQSSNIYVFTTNQDAVDVVLTQLPGIQYKKEKLDINKKKEKKTKKGTQFQQQIEAVKDIIINAKSNNVPALRKEELRDKIGISYESRGNFTRILTAIKPFLEVNNIKITNREIVLNDHKARIPI